MKTIRQTILLVISSVLLSVLVLGCQAPQVQVSWQETTPTPAASETLPPSEPTATPAADGQAAAAPTPTAAPSATRIPPSPTPVLKNALEMGLRPGSVVSNPDRNRLFYITVEGMARRIESWIAFYALGFRREAVITLEDELLDQIALAGHLTRHLHDEAGYHYWAVEGTLWAIDGWQTTLTDPLFRGVPPTQADDYLLASMPAVTAVPDSILVRDGTKLYVKQGGAVYPVVGPQVYQAFGYEFNQAVEVPHGALAAYDQEEPLTRFLRSDGEIFEIVKGQRRPIPPERLAASGHSEEDVRTVTQRFLNAFPRVDPDVYVQVKVPLANLRQGPGTGYKVMDQAQSGDRLVPLGRTRDSSWFKVRHQERTVWVAAKVYSLTGDIASLPQIDAQVVYAAAPAKQPTPTAAPLKPLTCGEVPIRGFGKVWADHIPVQHWLGCPMHDEVGTGAAVQQFQHGVMVWVEQDSVEGADPVYAFFEDGTYQRFGTVRPPDPAKVGETPSGFYEVGKKFAAVYWEGTGAQVKERLGYATTEQMDSPGAFQRFWYGRMLWLGTIDRIFVVDDRPHVWQSFEDTF